MKQSGVTVKILTFLCLTGLVQPTIEAAVDPLVQLVKPGAATAALPHSGLFQGRGDGVHTCPVTGEKVSEKSLKLELYGRTVYFCCHGCLKAAQQNPEKFVKPTLEEQGTAVRKVLAKTAQGAENAEYCND